MELWLQLITRTEMMPLHSFLITNDLNTHDISEEPNNLHCAICLIDQSITAAGSHNVSFRMARAKYMPTFKWNPPPFVFSIEMTRDQASLSFVPPCPWAPERSVTGTQTTDPSVPAAITRGRRVHHCLLITCPFENNCFIIALLALNCKGFWWWAAYYILRIEIIILKKLLALDLSSNLEKCLVEIFVQAAHKISLSFSR